MSYQVLARKWRPQNFADVVGQEHVLTALANGLSMGRIHHAYLFSGTRGVGKTSIARLLAKGLNCETGITATPCGQCDNCREIEQGRFVDLIEIDAASRTKVEDTRDLLDNVQYAPARGRFKVYLIDEVHMLSRHSFNALLKTLEEPPSHVKFLLATTDPQKLPVTILSRCLQFHLKALDVGLIRGQLEKVLHAEHIESDARALQLLARAADGSMRDALSLTDQAIAMGKGSVSTDIVSQMLGLLDAEQPLAMVEALERADGAALMAQVENAASRGVDWEALLVETLALLHRIAMIQLLPTVVDMADNDGHIGEQRLHELARTLSPQDIQLYYQTLLVGRKELAYAPDRRMGVEMTLLRALAFSPKVVIPEIAPLPQIAIPVHQVPVPRSQIQQAAASLPTMNEPAVSRPPEPDHSSLPTSTAQLLQARTQLKRQQEDTPPKKGEPAASLSTRPAGSALERLAAAAEQSLQRQSASTEKNKPTKQDAYRWKAQASAEPVVVEPTATPKALRTALEHEKTPELSAKLAVEALARDEWAAEINELQVPKLVQQLALNAYKETLAAGKICLHLRPSQRHLNSESAQKVLADAMSAHAGQPIELTVVEDEDLTVRTPLEWRHAIYEEKLAQARQSIISDNTIQTLCRFFDAELDEESIRPV